MKTLRMFLESSEDITIVVEDINKMSAKLGISFEIMPTIPPRFGGNRSAEYLNHIKAQTIINEFQIKFGLDEEF
tara:strand:+ start:69 stop:290 length:222 start_codon:yes stop_codon:yes gene_type:complete